MHDSTAGRTSVIDLPQPKRAPKVLVLFGTRPEAIKLAPVIHELDRRGFESLVVSSSQHKSLLTPFLRSLEIHVDLDLGVMKKDQSPNDVCSRVVAKLDKILVAEQPDMIIVQGDTTTALAGALAAFNRKIAVGHVEAGLRSGDLMSPFPEEMNRRLITQIATLHFAATDMNRANLLAENVAASDVIVTGNPVVDSLHAILRGLEPSERISGILAATATKKRILLTTHRRESFGDLMSGNLKVLRQFVERHKDVCVLFPVHPNPNVRAVTSEILGDAANIHLLDPLDYSDFLALMRSAWLVVSDSGGVQEEAPSLGKPLLVIRENTERPEALESGVAKLVTKPAELRRSLEDNYAADTWLRSVEAIANPFGDGRAAERIVKSIAQKLGHRIPAKAERMAA
jgi:UDP-N-acetylglucosamine 2-epimerase (non-hydrolysing)